MAKMRMTAAGRRGDRGGGGMQHNGCHRQAFGAQSGQHPNMHSGQGWCGGALEWPAYQPFTRKCVQQATGQFTHSPTAQPSRTAQPHSPPPTDVEARQRGPENVLVDAPRHKVRIVLAIQHLLLCMVTMQDEWHQLGVRTVPPSSLATRSTGSHLHQPCEGAHSHPCSPVTPARTSCTHLHQAQLHEVQLEPAWGCRPAHRQAAAGAAGAPPPARLRPAFLLICRRFRGCCCCLFRPSVRPLDGHGPRSS